jgi:SAM-dependent methyltransferase
VSEDSVNVTNTQRSQITSSSEAEPTSSCRGCEASGLEVMLSLGKLPLANALVAEDQLGQPERRYPLDLAYCSECALVQITVSVTPEELFIDYAYFSSYADSVVANAKELVERTIEERSLGPNSLAMEVASNDGYLLQYYVQSGVPVLGIDPAENVIPEAEARGVTSLAAFFGTDLAEELRASGRRADVLHANNVLAHVPDLNGFVYGIGRVLADDGVAIIETPYVKDLVEKLEFDTIYHEHLFYYSVTALKTLFARNGLDLVDVDWIPIHGGSLRVFASPTGATKPRPSVSEYLAAEEEAGVARPEYYRGFGERVSRLSDDLRALLQDLKERGHSISAYGAAAKGATLLNTLGVGHEIIDAVADRSPHKQGHYMPGVRIPIASPEQVFVGSPDYVLLLAWNYADEVLKQQDEYRYAGGRFIIPVPEPKVV